MTKYTLKMLSPDGGILTLNGERIGLISNKESEFRVIGGEFNGLYKSVHEFERKIGKKLYIEHPVISIQEPEAGTVEGFPVKHSPHHNVSIEPIPNYTRTISSDIKYAAGYYGIKFATGWTPSFCPKVTTLFDSEYIGPFKTKIEMRHQISAKSKISNV
jgi:hypothetical protein